MEKENKKLKDKYMKKERSRLIKLAELAYKLDPRIKKIREAEELEKVFFIGCNNKFIIYLEKKEARDQR